MQLKGKFMINQCERIKTLNEEMLKDPNENTYTIIAHTNEELGEFSTAVCVEDGSSVKGYKELDESSVSEAIDLLICTMSLYYVRGGETKNIASMMDKKLNKWEKKMEPKNEH